MSDDEDFWRRTDEEDLPKGQHQELGNDGESFWERCTTAPMLFSTAFLIVAAGEPKQPLFTLCFVVLEVCGGAGGINKVCDSKRITRGPVVELKSGFDLLDEDIFIWLLRLALAGIIWLLVLEPPCTTFSLARRPPLRGSRHPEGYDLAERLTHIGNLLEIMCALFALA